MEDFHDEYESEGLIQDLLVKGGVVVIAYVIAFIGYPFAVFLTVQSDLFTSVFGYLNPFGLLLTIAVYGILLYVLMTMFQILVGE